MVLATVSKGISTMAEYYMKMKGLVDEMAAVGHKLEVEELVSYILTGLDTDFNPVVTTVMVRVEPISVAELYALLISFEQCMKMQNEGSESSMNMAAKGCHGAHGGRGGGGRGGFWRGNKGGRGSGSGNCGNFQAGVFCQLCGKEGHAVVRCFKRFDTLFIGPPQPCMEWTPTGTWIPVPLTISLEISRS